VSAPTLKVVRIDESLFAGNDRAAADNRERLTRAGILAINVLAAPGAGKTSLIVRTIQALGGRRPVGVIEGDLAGSVDAAKVLAAGAADAVQINTGGQCHLDAAMVRRALDDLDLSRLEVVFVENVGNLVCPTHWALGEHLRVCVVGAAEGHDKPLKYPQIFAASDAVVLNKTDLIELVDFDRAAFVDAVRALNPRAPIFEVSCRSGAGLAPWVDWLIGLRARRLEGGTGTGR
jgi:hydrogenase nickel incorporation protein HypB